MWVYLRMVQQLLKLVNYHFEMVRLSKSDNQVQSLNLLLSRLIPMKFVRRLKIHMMKTAVLLNHQAQWH